MFDVRPMPQQVSRRLLDRAILAEPATIGHFRFRGFPSGALRALTPSHRIVGTAVTLSVPAFDSTLLHHAAGLIRPGDILLIDRLGDHHHACLGGGVAVSLYKMGLTGIIVDGPCADPEELRQSRLPVWGRGLSAITTRAYGIGGAMNVPASIGGAVALPGDLVIADEGGIVILPEAEAEADIERAIAMQAAERELIPQVSTERPLGVLSGASKLVLAKQIQIPRQV
jgi:4-hydroxy-4-methyl-2-oxoglutarate aldolase